MCSSKPSKSVPNSGDDKEIGGAVPRSKLITNDSLEFPEKKNLINKIYSYNK